MPTIRRLRLAEAILYSSLALLFAFLVLARPPLPFLVLLLGPIALAAALYEFAGGTLAALAALAAVGLFLALDPEPLRRAQALQDAWPILLSYVIVGPLVGWLVSRERERDQELATTARRLRTVQEIVQAINTSLDPQVTLNTIIAETERIIPFERAAILLRMDDILRVVATSQDAYMQKQAMGQAFALQETAAGQVVQQQRIWLLDPDRIERYADTRSLCSERVSCLLVPLQIKGTAIGAMALVGKNLDQITETDRETLIQIMDQTAIAIEHARLHRLERERAKALAAISEAGREIAASLDLQRTLQLVIAKAAETLPMDAGGLFVFDESAELYRMAVSHNLPPEQVEKITFAFDEGVPGWVVKHRQPLVIDDATADPRVHPYVVDVGVQSVLAIPLISHERMVGVLNLFCQTGQSAFDSEALRLGQVYADQAAVFIENARLVERLRRAAAELEGRVERRTRELRDTQAQVIRAEKMAAIGRLAGSVAHEVNNPLQAVTLHLQLIADRDLGPDGNQQIHIIQQELDRIADLVQRLLEFQRPKGGEQTRQDIPLLLDEILVLASKQLQRAGVTVTCDLPDDLPAVLGVGDQLKQVFLNLVLNALEAMPHGGVLAIDVQSASDELIIRFHDTGAGIKPDSLEQLFEPFFSTKHGGTGLGLAVSQEIVRSHGGALSAENRPEGGATFGLTLPVQTAKQPEVYHAQ
ncbi:MAG: GAF domain-containing protein [Candidatus Promineifilaceae bacterium]|nr:GAF domain-containing protein [Candidatus Promineifilaceae bacterium]